LPVASAPAWTRGAPAPAPPSASSRFRRWALAAPIATLAIIGGVLYWRSAQTPALANRDTVVLANFTNRTGDAMFDDTLTEALAVQLRQSPFLNVLNEQQQQATLRLMGRDPMAPLTTEVGRELCQRAGAKALLGGTIASLGSAYVLTLNAQDCVTGEVLAEEQVQANGKEGVLGALGEAVLQFRERLGESLASIQRYDAPVEQASTSSLEALKAYSQGTMVRRTQGDLASVPFFKRAIELDPDFALAHARLGTVYSNIGEQDAARKATLRAYELRERVSDRERFYIEARYHTTVTEDVGKAIEIYQLLLATYPDDYAAGANLGGLLRGQGRVTEAIPLLETATQLAPDQPNPFLNLGHALNDVERYADARRAFERSIALQDSTNARIGLFVLGTFTGDDALAQAQVEAVRGRRDELNMTGVRIQAALYKGRVSEARALGAEWMDRMEQEGRQSGIGEPVLGTMFSEAVIGNRAETERVLANAERRGYLTPGTADEQLLYAALVSDRARARKVYPVALKEPAGVKAADRKRALDAMLALAEGRPADAFELLDPPSMNQSEVQQTLLWTIAALHAERPADAIRGLDFLASSRSKLGLDALLPWLLVERARTLVAQGRVEDGRAAYQRFFDLWKNADKDVPLLVQARAEFAKLGT
jgi:tetratricopeptide (TPR) repeat protein